MNSLCPVCGHDRATTPQVTTCPCCGDSLNPKAFDDKKEYQRLLTARRQAWLHEGMPWGSSDLPKPVDWNPQQQLARLALQATRSRVKGRPPRLLPLAIASS